MLVKWLLCKNLGNIKYLNIFKIEIKLINGFNIWINLIKNVIIIGSILNNVHKKYKINYIYKNYNK